MQLILSAALFAIRLADTHGPQNELFWCPWLHKPKMSQSICILVLIPSLSAPNPGGHPWKMCAFNEIDIKTRQWVKTDRATGGMKAWRTDLWVIHLWVWFWKKKNVYRTAGEVEAISCQKTTKEIMFFSLFDFLQQAAEFCACLIYVSLQVPLVFTGCLFEFQSVCWSGIILLSLSGCQGAKEGNWVTLNGNESIKISQQWEELFINKERLMAPPSRSGMSVQNVSPALWVISAVCVFPPLPPSVQASRPEVWWARRLRVHGKLWRVFSRRSRLCQTEWSATTTVLEY